MAADLLIRISGDAADYEKALEQAKSKTESLSDGLKSIGVVAGVAFAALTAEAYTAVQSFRESEEATNRLTQALQQQGIFSTELVQRYKDIASAIQEKTGADDDSVVSAVASFQSMVGQTQVSEGLINAVVDLAAAQKLDLDSAFNLVAKSATNGTEVLKRYGIQVEDTGSRAGNLAAVQEALNQKFGGAAEAAAAGLGGIEKLKRQFGEIQEAIGARLAPAVTTLINGFTEFFGFISGNKALLDFIVSVGVAAAVVTGIATAVAAAGIAFAALSAALTAAGIATGAMTVATRALMGATGIGLLVILITEIALNWNSVWPRMQGVFAAFVKSVSELAGGFGELLKGVFNLDSSQISAGFDRIKGALSKGMTEYNAVVTAKVAEREKIETDSLDKQDTVQKDAADRAERLKKAHENRLLEIQREKRNLLVLQASDASKETIALQQQENALLEQMDDEKNAKIVGVLAARLARVRQMQVDQQVEEADQRRTFNEQILAQDQEFNLLSDAEKADFIVRNQNTLAATILTEKDARAKAAKDAAIEQINNNNTYLLNQQKFGKSYADIYALMHSQVYTGTKQAAGELAALTQSSNSTLKGIGKAAAIANVIIKTAESAMNIYAGFSTIPIVGPALGVAGAAAAVAFGAEQVGQITAAADGGLITGGIPGRDSVPAMLMPGEMVVPTRNFEEVISAVGAARGGGGSGDGGLMRIEVSLKDDLVEFIEMKIIERQNFGTSFLGVS